MLLALQDTKELMEPVFKKQPTQQTICAMRNWCAVREAAGNEVPGGRAGEAGQRRSEQPAAKPLCDFVLGSSFGASGACQWQLMVQAWLPCSRAGDLVFQLRMEHPQLKEHQMEIMDINVPCLDVPKGVMTYM